MKSCPSSLRNSRGPFIAATLAATLIGGWLLTPDSRSQAPATAPSNAALNALIVKLKTQQDAIIANQTKIEAQTALLKENLRQAKIYAGRGGSGHR